jgi:sporulation protein YlmC with PRC-barrel domain
VVYADGVNIKYRKEKQGSFLGAIREVDLDVKTGMIVNTIESRDQNAGKKSQFSYG